ncbi:hypothetical protein VTK73DRAFT_9441 [Phialemonium thermophilum]|uniref:cAMP-independent regulatory protein pac2 n=1 Tax=Phialemonium thermophilum TaxID=223376 RepID=A0ABR3XLM0_9PEZI
MMETYYGLVRTPADAIKLFEACRLGLLPRVQRRLSEKERQAIRSGSVFVWDEREAGMRRWTDGKSWSASRVSGSFLTYREMEGKRGGGFVGNRSVAVKTPDSGRASDEDQDDGEPDGYRYKPDGLMKQSFSITTSNGQHLHLISYYSRLHPGHPDLPQPSTDPTLRHIVPLKGLYPESSMNEAPVPALTRAPMPQPHYMAIPHQGPPAPVPHSLPPHTYASQYSQTYYSWPPSPVSTPPYSYHAHYSASSYPPGHAPRPSLPLPPPHHPSYTPHSQQSSYPPGTHHEVYERVPLPPLARSTATMQPSVGATSAPPPTVQQSKFPPFNPSGPHVTPAQTSEPPAIVDPRLSGSSSTRRTEGPLPALSHASQNDSSAAATSPLRNSSVSPSASQLEASSQSNGPPPSTNKASLSALLLHPTPTSSEPNSANTGNNSTSSSPRAGVPPPPPSVARVNGISQTPQKRTFMEDTRVLQVLDKKFCS